MVDKPVIPKERAVSSYRKRLSENFGARSKLMAKSSGAPAHTVSKLFRIIQNLVNDFLMP